MSRRDLRIALYGAADGDLVEARLRFAGGVPYISAELPGIVAWRRKEIRRDLRVQFTISAGLVAADGRVVSMLRRECSARYDVWDEAFRMQVGARRYWASDSAGALEGLHHCLDLDAARFDRKLGRQPAHLVLRVEDDVHAAPGERNLTPAHGGLFCFDVWESPTLPDCTARGPASQAP